MAGGLGKPKCALEEGNASASHPNFTLQVRTLASQSPPAYGFHISRTHFHKSASYAQFLHHDECYNPTTLKAAAVQPTPWPPQGGGGGCELSLGARCRRVRNTRRARQHGRYELPGRIRAGIGPKHTISLDKLKSGPSPGTPREREGQETNSTYFRF